MKKMILGTFVFAIAVMAGSTAVSAQMMKDENPMVGGAAMYKTKNIVDNAVNSKDHTTLVAAVQAAGLVDTLKSAGPFTVFAPTNAAFDKLPAGTVEALLKPENKDMLTKIPDLSRHRRKQRFENDHESDQERRRQSTVQDRLGGTLTAMMEGKNLVLVDEKGGKSMVTIADVRQSNGVIHVVDTVVLPN
jgi:uncharacterized surface protein with fasciclin (FAS1) repeats